MSGDELIGIILLLAFVILLAERVVPDFVDRENDDLK